MKWREKNRSGVASETLGEVPRILRVEQVLPTDELGAEGLTFHLQMVVRHSSDDCCQAEPAEPDLRSLN